MYGLKWIARGKRIYLQHFIFLVSLGLCCCVRAFSSCGEQGPLFFVVRGLLIAVASLLRSTRAGFRSCGSRALECRLSSCGAQA